MKPERQWLDDTIALIGGRVLYWRWQKLTGNATYMVYCQPS